MFILLKGDMFVCPSPVEEAGPRAERGIIANIVYIRYQWE